MKKILTDVKFWIISTAVLFILALLFFPFPSWETNLSAQKELGDALISEGLVLLENVSFPEAGSRKGWEVNEGKFTTLTGLRFRAKVVNKSDKRLSLIRGRIKISFKKQYKSSKDILPFEFGYVISPKSEKYYSTWINFKSGELIPLGLLTDVEEPVVLAIDEIWAETYYNPFDEIINYFREKYWQS